MTVPVFWGSPEWIAAAVGLLAVTTAALLWNYGRARASIGMRVACALLKAVGLTAIVLALLEPLLTGTRPRRGANAFVVLTDNSQSLLIRDGGAKRTRGDAVRDLLRKETPWMTRLGQDFDVRRYVFDTHLRAVDGYEGIAFDGAGSSLSTSLAALSRRFRGLPLAGVLVFTDGNRTDAAVADASQLPPVYPVTPPSRGKVKDVGVGEVSISQTNFESAPVVVKAEVSAAGYEGDSIVATVVDEAGAEVERQQAVAGEDGKPVGFRFQFRPEKPGVSFYTVKAFAATEGGEQHRDEQTDANNGRLVVVDQGGGPYRVLYVSGRPNWEYKFLRRSVDEDEQMRLVALLRIAKRQPKFDFQRSGSRTNSPFYDGFDNADPETAERYDEPVIVRIGTEDEAELRAGFPKAADELYRYHAVILDDLEAEFFTADQLTLLRNFVSVRGGGLLMLGGPDSFADGKYDRTPVGDLLPVYLNKSPAVRAGEEYRLVLTREGWLQPWVRTRKTEDEERRRLASLPPFHTLSRAGEIKPGAVVLSEVKDSLDQPVPALVAQQFGKGHVAALMIGDFWRWGLRRKNATEDDFDRSWRQTVRWLVGDVPGRVEVDVRPASDSTAPAVKLTARVADPEFRPLDNAKVAFRVTLPGGEEMTLDAEPEGREPGVYAATYVTKQPGPYRFTANVAAPDGSVVGEREVGWAAQPAADEFARLDPDREYLKELATSTGGEVIDGDDLDSFVASLSSRDAPITEPWTSPLWHHPIYFLLAIACLAGEWGLRRVHGLA